jgi:N6-adenosine-specific RNA methylase IME4
MSTDTLPALELPRPVAVRSSDLLCLVGGFSTIVADPPWDVKAGPPPSGDGEKWGRPNGGNGGASRPLKYNTMTVEEIAAMPVKEKANDDAHLYIWTINAYVRETYDIARAWGFEPSTMLYWLKSPMGIGLGGAFSLCVEPILFCRRGKLAAKKRLDRNWWNWPRGRHSAKPEEFQTIVESVSPGPYLELFARRERPGWTTWGNEA